MTYKTIKQVWNALDNGKTINWGNDSYKVMIEDSHCDYQDNHWTHRNGKVLTVRCISNGFGSLLDTTELGKLY